MHVQRILLGSIGGVFVAAALAYCCGSYGNAPSTVKVSHAVQSALVRDGRLYAVNDQGELLMLATPRGELQSLGKFDGKLLDIATGKACFAVKNLVYVADLAKGTILASHLLAKPTAGVCFVGPDRLAIPNGSKVQILDAANGKTIQTIELKENEETPAGNVIACRANGDRLYAAVAGIEKGLVVIDAKKSQIIDRIAIGLPGGLQEFHIHNDKALLVSHNHGGYGIWIYYANCVDLKTGKTTRMKVPSELGSGSPRDHDWAGTALIVGPGDNFCLASPAGVRQFDAQGNLIGPVPTKTGGRFLTVWNRSAVYAGKDSLEIAPLSVKAAPSE